MVRVALYNDWSLCWNMSLVFISTIIGRNQLAIFARKLIKIPLRYQIIVQAWVIYLTFQELAHL